MRSTDSPLAVAGTTPGAIAIEKKEWLKGERTVSRDFVIEEVPVALVYNGISHAVMMATPVDLEDFAIGFSLSEGLLLSADELLDFQINHCEQGIELCLTVLERSFNRLKQKRRNLTGRSGCGLCGAESLQQALSIPMPITATVDISPQAINRAASGFIDHQKLQRLTGGCHGAAWCDEDGHILMVREDVGRHNALDKLLGALAKSEPVDGFILVSSRASYEMVTKAAHCGISCIASLSAPTSLAISLAEKCNVCLVGFVAPGRHLLYTNGEKPGF